MRPALSVLGYALLGLLAGIGVALSLGFALISTDVGRGLVIRPLLRLADDALAGSIELRSFRMRSGGIELQGVRVLDPDGDVVLVLERARVDVDLARIRAKAVGFRVELQDPAVVLKREADGSLSIARAFAPTHPSPKKETQPLDWTFRLTRLTVRGGSVRYVDAGEHAAFQAEGLDLDGRGVYGPRGAAVDAALRGTMLAPERAPIAIDVAGRLREKELRVRVLRVVAGDTALDAAGALDTATWRGKVAVLALGVDASQVTALAPGVPLGGDLTGTAYAESDGAAATAALELRPRGGGGSAEAAAALRLPPAAPAAGLEVRLEALDLARVLRGAPATSLQLEARARATGRDLATLEGAAAVSLAPSRLGAGRLGPVEVRAGASRGAIEVTRLEAALPGGSLRGRGRWRRTGELAGQLVIDAADLEALRKNGELLLARRLPPLAGAAHVEADLGGTERAPTADLRARSSSLAVAGVAASDVALTAALAGPLAAPRAQVEGQVARVAAGALEARSVTLVARLQGRAGDVELRGAVPDLGLDPVAVSGAGALSTDGRVLTLSALTVAWPRDRFELQQPARVVLGGPSVDRLDLAAGDQRLQVAGGFSAAGKRRVLDARLQLERLDLALLPAALFPRRLALAGRVDADVTARGPASAPRIQGRVDLSGGAAMGLDGLSARAEVGYDAAQRRVTADLSARRGAGGTVTARGALPVPLATAPASAAVDLAAEASGWPVAELLRVVELELPHPVGGTAEAAVRLRGTVGAPTLEASVSVEGGQYGPLEPLAARVRLDDAGAEAVVRAGVDYRGSRALDLEAKVPLRLAAVLRQPGPVLRRVPDAPLTATAGVPGFDLAGIAGRLGVPADLRGRVQAAAELSGSARAPRGTVRVELAGGSYDGYRDVAAVVSAAAADARTAVEGTVALQGHEIGRLEASLGLPPERLGGAAERERAALHARLDLPGNDLRRTWLPVLLAGELAGHVAVDGSLAAPRLDAELRGKGVEVSGHPLGDFQAQARAADRALRASLQLAVTTGGTLDASLDAEADLGLPALRRGELSRAPAHAQVRAKELDLAFLPAVAPGIIRSASGKLEADVVAAGPLVRMVPRGTLTLDKGSLSVAEFGEWSDIAVQASLTEDDLRVDKLSARRRDGHIEVKADAKGLARRGTPADFRVSLRSESLPIPRAGQDLATVDLEANVKGTFTAEALEADLDVPRATVRLPNRLPRRIQPLDQRSDIVVGEPKKPPRQRLAGPEGQPYRVKAHLVVPGKFFVKGDSPRVNVELKADVTAERARELALDGEVTVVRGQVEPIGGRIFDIKRGRVQFTGGDYNDAVLDISALYDNPTAKVTVTVAGTIAKPDIKLSSEPAMDDAQIALLIATGRSELKAGSGGVGTLTGEQVGYAALGAVAMQVFKDVLADKLPVDSVALDSSQIRAGKYVTDKIYVGYTHRFNAKPEQFENTNEVQVEYQITPRWTFQTSYGDAQTGGASVIWSKDY